MNKQDIDKAFGALNNAQRTLYPIITALSQANEVLSVLSNATVLQDTLLTDTAILKVKFDELTNKIVDLEAQTQTANEEVAQAKSQGQKDIAEAKSQAKEQVAQILASIATQTKDAQAAFAEKQADLANKTTQLQSELDASTAALVAQKTDLETQIATLQKKLDAITAQAKKFADALGG